MRLRSDIPLYVISNYAVSVSGDTAVCTMYIHLVLATDANIPIYSVPFARDNIDATPVYTITEPTPIFLSEF
jgi:hypothetical protein